MLLLSSEKHRRREEVRIITMNCGHNSEAVHILHPKKLFQSIDQDKKTATIDDYCLTLIGLQFYGQTSMPEVRTVAMFKCSKGTLFLLCYVCDLKPIKENFFIKNLFLF